MLHQRSKAQKNMPIWLFLGSLLAIGLADRAGRRLLLIISGLGMGLSNLGLVLNQEQLLNHVLMDNMLPVSALCSFYVFFTLGFGSLPFVILGEIFPAQSKVGNIHTGCPIANCAPCTLQNCHFVFFTIFLIRPWQSLWVSHAFGAWIFFMPRLISWSCL